MSERDDDRSVALDKGEGETPAMNRPGPRADEDRELSAPGNRGWDEPASEAPETIEGAVRADPDSPGAAVAGEDEPDEIPEPNEPG